MTKPLTVIGRIAFLLTIVLSALAANPIANAQEARRLTSITSGFFYASIARGDGVIQLSDCRDVKEAGRVSKTRPFACVRDSRGMRCTADGSLDVIFVFGDRKTCEADRKENLDSEEE